MGFQDSSCNISTLRLVILSASFFRYHAGKNRRTVVTTTPRLPSALVIKDFSTVKTQLLFPVSLLT